MTSFVDVRLGNDVKRFVIVPTWVAARLNERQLNLGAIFNFAKMSSLFNQMDLAELLAAQDSLHYIVGRINVAFTDDVGSDARYQYADQSGSWYLHNMWRDQVRHDYAQSEMLDNILNYSNSQQVRDGLENRLYSVDEVPANPAYPAPCFNTEDNGIGLTIHEVRTETAVIVVTPGHFKANTVGKQSNNDRAIVALLTSLYRTMSVPMVSRTSLFKRYLEAIIL